MAGTKIRNAPDLAGWAIAAGAGIVAFGLCVLLGKFALTTAVALAVVIFAVVGLILGWQKAQGAGTAEASVAPGHAVQAPEAVAPPEAKIIAPEPAAVVAAAAPMSAFVTMVPEAAAPIGPERLAGPRGGVADDLKQIEGIGPALEAHCNGLGFYHYDQIAHWSEADVAWVEDNMPRFKGRILRDKWVAQASLIVAEGLGAFRIRAKTNDY